MSNYKKVTAANGTTRYFEEDGETTKAIKTSEVPQEVKDALEAAPDNQLVDGDGNTVEPENGNEDSEATAADQERQDAEARRDTRADDGNEPKTDAKADETPARTVDSGLQQDEAGMGFPRVNGSTVDIFDGKTPHTHVRNVGGVMVPLSADNYNKRTDSEITEQINKLRKDGKVTV